MLRHRYDLVDRRLLIIEAYLAVAHELRTTLVSEAELLLARQRAVEIVRRLLDQLVRVAALLNGLWPLLGLVGRAAPAALRRLVSELAQVHPIRVLGTLWHRLHAGREELRPFVEGADWVSSLVILAGRLDRFLHQEAGVLARQILRGFFGVGCHAF